MKCTLITTIRFENQLPALRSLEPVKLPCQVSSSCRPSPLATASRSAGLACRSAFGAGGVNCTPLEGVSACVKASQAGAAAAAPGLGVVNDAQSPATHSISLQALNLDARLPWGSRIRSNLLQQHLLPTGIRAGNWHALTQLVNNAQSSATHAFS